MKNIDTVFTEENLIKALESNNEKAEKTISNLDKFEKLIQRLEKKLKLVPVIGKYMSDIACMVSLVRSYIKKEYTDIPIGTIISIASTLIYIVSLVDLIPDLIPVFGFVDDAALLVMVMKSINSDVEEYKKWRIDNNRQIIDAL